MTVVKMCDGGNEGTVVIRWQWVGVVAGGGGGGC